MDTGEQLCLACGLCCDGALFDNVRLGTDDDARKTEALGLPVKYSRAKKPIAFFRQPCAALCEDRSCHVYANRPTQCRTFECGLFKKLRAEEVAFETALRSVKQARRRVDEIRRLFRKLDDSEERLSLDKRFRRVQRRLESGYVDEATAEIFAELTLAVQQFDLLARKKFYTMASES